MNGNQFYIEPAGDNRAGLSGLGEIVAIKKQEREQRKAQEEKDQRQRDAVERYYDAMKSEDPMEIMNVAVEYPEISEQAQKAFGFKQDFQKKEAVDFSSQILSNPAKAGDTAKRRIEILTAQGRDPTNTVEWLKKYDQDPESALKEMEGNFATTFPTEYKSLRDSMTKEEQGFSLSPGEARYDAKGKLIVQAPKKEDAPIQPPSGFRWTSDKNLEAIPGGPAEKSAVPSKEEIINIQKPDGTVQAFLATDSEGLKNAVLGGGVERGMVQPRTTISAREIQTAKGKIQVAKMLKNQIKEAREKFEPLKNSFEAGPQAYIFRFGEKGSNFDAAIDGLRSTVTALTRTPGVGSMSDYEAKMDQAKLPDRKSGEYESTVMQKLDQLEQLANTIEIGYTGILSDTEEMAGTKQVGRFQVEEVKE